MNMSFEYADDLAEATVRLARRLVNVTSEGDTGFASAVEVDRVIDALADLAGQISEAVDHAAHWLAKAQENEVVELNEAADPEVAVRQAVEWLKAAGEHLQQASKSLGSARLTTSHLSTTDSSELPDET